MRDSEQKRTFPRNQEEALAVAIVGCPRTLSKIPESKSEIANFDNVKTTSGSDDCLCMYSFQLSLSCSHYRFYPRSHLDTIRECLPVDQHMLQVQPWHLPQETPLSSKHQSGHKEFLPIRPQYQIEYQYSDDHRPYMSLHDPA